MKLINYFSLEEKTGKEWSKLKKGLAIGTSMFMLSPIAREIIGTQSQPVNTINPNTSSCIHVQESNPWSGELYAGEIEDYQEKDKKQEDKKKNENKKEKKSGFERFLNTVRSIMILTQPSYRKLEGMFNKLSSLKKEDKKETSRETEAKKPETAQDLAGMVNEYSLPEIELTVKGPYGRRHGDYTIKYVDGKGPFIFDPNNDRLDSLPIPEDGIIILKTKSPYPDHRIDLMMKDSTGKKLIHPLTGEAVHLGYIDTSFYNLPADTRGNIEILLEVIGEQRASIVVQYNVEDLELPREEAEYYPEEEKPIPPIDEMLSEFVEPEKPGKEKNLNARFILSAGTDTVNITEECSKEFDSAVDLKAYAGDLHLTLNKNLLVHANFKYHHKLDLVNTVWEQEVDYINLKAGFYYAFARPLLAGLEANHNTITSNVVDIYDPYFNSYQKHKTHNTLLLGKLGFGSFGKHNFALVGMGGLHIQHRNVEDNFVDSDFSQVTQQDLNYVYGAELYVDLFKDPESLPWIIIMGNVLKYGGIDRVVEHAELPKLKDGTSYNILGGLGLKHKGIGAGILLGYSSNEFKYIDNSKATTSNFTIRGALNFTFNLD
ncbi:hypothetical protein KY348_00995 [Candidatus Woesearchaeota archaeon]|nr:hypothetical protein [Candidatus Woesearchaeota archaeon]